MPNPATDPKYRKHVNSYDPKAPLPKVGSRWVWEINGSSPSIEEVTEVTWNGEEWWITTKSIPAKPLDQLHGRDSLAWNDVGRFWEACTPIGGGMRGMVTQGQVPQDA